MNDFKYFIQDDYIKFKDFFLSRNPNIKLYKKGSYLITSGKNSSYIYFILDGKVIDIFTHKNGCEKYSLTHGKNTIVPLYSPISPPIKKLLSIKALEDCHVIIFTKREFANFLQSNSDLNNQLYISCIMHINFLLFENLSLHADSGITRISIFLSSYIKSHNPVNNVIHVSQKEISNAVGLNLINTSRNLKILKEMNIINTGRNKIIVLDANKLSSFY